jgi:hypothetical protein
MQYLHAGLEEFNACWPECKRFFKARRQKLHLGQPENFALSPARVQKMLFQGMQNLHLS